MVSFAARTLEKPEQRQKPWRALLQVPIILYIAWVAYKTFRDMEQNWVALGLAVAILLGIVKQFLDFIRAQKPSPWVMIEVRPESVTLYGRDGSFHQLPLPKSHRLFPDKTTLVMRWDRTVPKRCRVVTFRSKRDLSEADFKGLQGALQEVRPLEKPQDTMSSTSPHLREDEEK